MCAISVISLDDLAAKPHAILADLRASAPVAWVPALNAFLVTGRELALQVMRDDDTFTVDDPRFSTGRVVGPSMLSTDGDAHARHRAPFARAFRLDAVGERFATSVAAEAARLLEEIAGAPAADLRASLTAPLAAATMVDALGLAAPVADVLAIYEPIVAAVSGLAAGAEPPAGALLMHSLSLKNR